MRDVWELDKFDVIVMNPPYQTSNEGEKKTHPIWDKFVNKSFEVLVEGGYMTAVHPSGWRNIDGRFKETQNLLKSKEIQYLEIHSFMDGLKTFGAKIDYDFYCLKNTLQSVNNLTEIKDCDGNELFYNLLEIELEIHKSQIIHLRR